MKGYIEINKILRDHKWFLLLISLGILLRLIAYFNCRSLWCDEAGFANGLIETPSNLLHKGLVSGHSAPPFFLYTTKILIRFFGNSEYVLRFLPLVSGIAGLFFIYFLALKIVPKNQALFVLFLFAINQKLIYFSNEFKPYCSDATITLIIFLLAFYCLRNPTPIRFIVFGIVAGFFSFCSFPSIFVYSGIMGALIIYNLSNREVLKQKTLWLSLLLFLAIFIFNKVIFIDPMRKNQIISGYWENSYFPHPFSFKGFKWYIEKPFELLKNPAGFNLVGITLFSSISGIIFLFKNNRSFTLFLTAPFIITYLASFSRIYPLLGRLSLFLVPVVLIFAGIGTISIFGLLKPHSKYIAYGFLLIFLLFPAYNALRRARKPFAEENIRPVVEYVISKKKFDQEIYVYYGAASAFKYYIKRFGYNVSWIKGVSARDDWNKYDDELENLLSRQKKPLWMIFSHVWDANGVHEEKYLVIKAKKWANQKDYFHAFSGATAYLFTPKRDFNKE